MIDEACQSLACHAQRDFVNDYKQWEVNSVRKAGLMIYKSFYSGHEKVSVVRINGCPL